MSVPAILIAGLLAASPAPPDLARRVEAYVQPYADSNNFSGCVLIANGSDVRLRRCWGQANRELEVPNTPETRFHVASVSKSFTAAAVLVLEQQGRLRVQDPVSRFVPGYPRGDAITLHHLLVHTSGIPNVNGFPDYQEKSRFAWTPAQIVSWFKDKPLEFEPGARYDYSNSNYNLLALVIENGSGMSYGEFLRRHVLEPAGLHDTGHDGQAGALVPRRAAGYQPVGLRDVENSPWLDWSVKTGNGSLYTTVDDLYRWDRALRAGKVLSAESLRKAHTDHVEGVGYGWFVRGGAAHPSVGIGGRAPGFSASLERYAEGDTVVAMVSNLYSSITHTMAAELGAIALGEDRRALIPAQAVSVPAEAAAAYVGRYQLGADFAFNRNMVAEVKRVEDGLALVGSGGGGTTFLIPLGPGRFLDRGYGGIVAFAAPAGGRSPSLTWTFGQAYRATRIGP